MLFRSPYRITVKTVPYTVVANHWYVYLVDLAHKTTFCNATPLGCSMTTCSVDDAVLERIAGWGYGASCLVRG